MKAGGAGPFSLATRQLTDTQAVDVMRNARGHK